MDDKKLAKTKVDLVTPRTALMYMFHLILLGLRMDRTVVINRIKKHLEANDPKGRVKLANFVNRLGLGKNPQEFMTWVQLMKSLRAIGCVSIKVSILAEFKGSVSKPNLFVNGECYFNLADMDISSDEDNDTHNQTEDEKDGSTS